MICLLLLLYVFCSQTSEYANIVLLTVASKICHLAHPKELFYEHMRHRYLRATTDFLLGIEYGVRVKRTGLVEGNKGRMLKTTLLVLVLTLGAPFLFLNAHASHDGPPNPYCDKVTDEYMESGGRCQSGIIQCI